MLIILPQTWLVIIPGNFLVDSAVLIIAMHVLKLTDKKRFYLKHILLVFVFGFLSDLLGALSILLLMFFELGGPMGDSPLITVPGLLIAAGSIFVLNYFVTFRKCEKALKLRLALTFAIATAPYTFLIPSAWIY